MAREGRRAFMMMTNLNSTVLGLSALVLIDPRQDA
jgi:hypothetical protein